MTPIHSELTGTTLQLDLDVPLAPIAAQQPKARLRAAAARDRMMLDPCRIFDRVERPDLEIAVDAEEVELGVRAGGRCSVFFLEWSGDHGEAG